MVPKTGAPWKQTPISRAVLVVSLGVPSKGALPPSSPHSEPTERDVPFPEPTFIHLFGIRAPFQVPQQGPYGERCPSPGPSSIYPSGSLVKERPPPLSGSPNRAPTERDSPFPEPTFIHLSKSLLNGFPSTFPDGTPIEKDTRLQSPPSGSPVKQPSSRFPKELSQREMLLLRSPPSTISQSS